MKTKGNDTLLRQWHMLQMIPRHPLSITTTQLLDSLTREGFNVDARTIQRDVQFLATKFPLVTDGGSEKPYRWRWMEGAAAFNLPGLSNTEALTFNFVERHLRPILPTITLEQLKPFFKAASEKLENLPDPIHSWLDKVRVIPPTQRLLPPKIDTKIQLVISEALMLDKQIKVTYQRSGEDTAEQHIIHPLALVERQPTVYLVCRNDSEENLWNLPLHRFQSAHILEESSQRPNDFNLDAHLESSKGLGFGGSGENIRLEAIFEKFSGVHLYETPLSQDQTISVLDDNHLKITATVVNTEQLRWWLLGFGERIEIIEPPELRGLMLETANRLHTIYNKK
jgi:predicted DNA-binding transcriptional regulator YafY